MGTGVTVQSSAGSGEGFRRESVSDSGSAEEGLALGFKRWGVRLSKNLEGFKGSRFGGQV
jgi:hypothetical protein